MKKEYTKPQMEVVEIQTAQMLWGGGSSSGGRGRESDDWDDEW